MPRALDNRAPTICAGDGGGTARPASTQTRVICEGRPVCTVTQDGDEGVTQDEHEKPVHFGRAVVGTVGDAGGVRACRCPGWRLVISLARARGNGQGRTGRAAATGPRGRTRNG